MINFTGLSAKNRRCILIAGGPSNRKVFENPSITNGKSVALINGVYKDWPYFSNYLFSLHPSKMAELYEPNDIVTVIGFKENSPFPKDINYIRVDRRNLTSGGSSLFAVENLLAMGYKSIEMYGVDLDGPDSSPDQLPYNRFRKFWKPLVGYPIVDHSDSKWFERGVWE